MVKQTFLEMKKNALEKIIVSENEYDERGYLDIRIFYDASNGAGTEWKPTKKGVTVRFELLKEFKEGIDKAYEELNV